MIGHQADIWYIWQLRYQISLTCWSIKFRRSFAIKFFHSSKNSPFLLDTNRICVQFWLSIENRRALEELHCSSSRRSIPTIGNLRSSIVFCIKNLIRFSTQNMEQNISNWDKELNKHYFNETALLQTRKYHQIHNNCYDFVVRFLNKINYKGRNNRTKEEATR